jgi:cysteine desulfurase
VERAADVVLKSVKDLREMSPLWEMLEDDIDINTIKWN